MADFRFVFCVVIFAILSLSCVNSRKYHVPVLVWESGNGNGKIGSYSSLARIDSDEFLNHFLKRVHNEKPTIVLFVEETLSVEDFSSQDAKHENAFPKLKSIRDSANRFEFLPSVENPASVLTGSEITAYGYSTADFTEDKDLNKNTIYIVKLEDADSMEDRSQLLHRHDEKISEIYNTLSKKYGNVVAVFTGQCSSWTEPEEVIRVRRAAYNTTDLLLQSNKTLIYTPESPVLRFESQEYTLTNPNSDYPLDEREKTLKAIYTFNIPELGVMKMRILFELDTPRTWVLSAIEFQAKNKEVVLLPNIFMGTVLGKSYHVSGPVTFSNRTVSITFIGLQVQPWLQAGQTAFSTADDSTPFFTAPIWTGIFVVSLLGMIMIWALTMIMDIRTMDQFDDPKGKTISVNVTD